MKRAARSIMFAICNLMILSFLSFADGSVPKPVIKDMESVVRVLAEYTDGYTTGSGFVIKSDEEETLIATNYHVVDEKPYSISVWVGENETVKASIASYSSQKDMCVLKLAHPISKKALLLGETPKQGDAVYVVGFPGAADYLSDREAHISADATITDGIISAIREGTVAGYGSPIKILQINAAINAGNSGGPVLNSDGEVVGISTYDVDDAQGIFGAIDVSELKGFIEDQALLGSNKAATIPIGLIIIVIAVIAGGILTTMIVMKNRKKTMNKNYQCLSEFMTAHPNGVGINDAVAMMLPVAVHMQKMHNNGRIHMQISPNTIFVGENNIILNEASPRESDRYTSGYAAPEVYRGVQDDVRSDIYSFCAVLYYIAFGKQPINALSRSESDTIELDDASFSELINSGMAVNIDNRIASMEEVINRIALYNGKTNTTDDTRIKFDDSTKKKAKNVKRAIVVVAIVALGVTIISYMGCYFAAKAKAKAGSFLTADKLLFAKPITELYDEELVEYVNAGVLMETRKYDEAKSAFEMNPEYLNSEEMILEVDYRNAIQCADANEFDKAIEIMGSLEKSSYKDAAEKKLEFKYRKGVYLLLEKQKYMDADSIFNYLVRMKYDGAEEMQKETQYLWAKALIEEDNYVDAYTKLDDIKGYSDAKEVQQSLVETIYAQGQSLYHSGKYDEARENFRCTYDSDYADSEDYLTLIYAHGYGYPKFSGKTAQALEEIFYFEDASELLLSNYQIAQDFLTGRWKGDGYYLKMRDDGHISYNLPWFDYGDYYTIVDGTVLLYPENDPWNKKALFDITAITPDCIEVYCHKNGTSYVLYR